MPTLSIRATLQTSNSRSSGRTRQQCGYGRGLGNSTFNKGQDRTETLEQREFRNVDTPLHFVMGSGDIPEDRVNNTRERVGGGREMRPRVISDHSGRDISVWGSWRRSSLQ